MLRNNIDNIRLDFSYSNLFMAGGSLHLYILTGCSAIDARHYKALFLWHSVPECRLIAEGFNT